MKSLAPEIIIMLFGRAQPQPFSQPGSDWNFNFGLALILNIFGKQCFIFHLKFSQISLAFASKERGYLYPIKLGP